MSIPTIFDVLAQLDFLRGLPAAYGVLLVAAILVMVGNQRWALVALLVQYLLAAVIFADILHPRLVVVKLLASLFVCLVMYINARQVHWGDLPEDITVAETQLLKAKIQARFEFHLLPTHPWFRITAVVVAAFMVWLMARTTPLPIMSLENNFSHSLAVFALVGMGLLGLSLTTEPLKAGMGLLLFMSGFELFYNHLEQSMAILVFLAATNLAITLVVAYLAQARYDWSTLLAEVMGEER